MQKIFLTLIYTLILTNTFGQISTQRQEFFKQEIESLINENRRHSGTIIISNERIKWDTTHWTIKSYITELDTIDNEGIGTRRRPTQEVINVFNESDYRTFNEQIINQGKDNFIKRKKVKGDKRNNTFNELLTIKFSQPLVSYSGDILIVQEQIDSRYCFLSTILMYKKINSKWTKYFEIKKQELCE
jgi:hypothetical protein